MPEKDLLEKFVDHLLVNYSPKKELVPELANILKMEKESVLRRLNGKVQFTIKEMGLIAQKLNISIDTLLCDKTKSTLLPVELLMPLSQRSMNTLIDEIEMVKNTILKDTLNKPCHLGYIFNSLPVEFFSPYDYLCKFMYFRWAYFFTDTSLGSGYKKWQLPQKLEMHHKDLVDYWNNFESAFYIWDNPVIWNLMKEIGLFYKMKILDEDDVLLIKKDLHDMLNNIESCIEERKNRDVTPFDLYISSVNIGMSCIYYYSDDQYLIDYQTPFIWSGLHKNNESFDKINTWINSMKKVSTLISGSGVIDRYIFFDEQHKIVDGTIF
ncbi:MAG: helix-turn-helix domain-containing protein [Dysgonomonas sp.]|nr:helix-turn-helix domain-containing protein [Dysgonomonas sp.]